MNKKTQMIIGIAAIAGVAYLLLKNKSKDKIFANLKGNTITGKNSKCKIYSGSCDAPVGTIIQDWKEGGQGIIVTNDSSHCIICSRSETPDGMPKQY